MPPNHTTVSPAGLRQRTIWDPPPANRKATSKAAAASVADIAPKRREVLLGIIRGRGDRGATIDELQAVTGWLTASLCPLVNKLANGKLIRDSGRTRPTRSGRPATVWIVTEGQR